MRTREDIDDSIRWDVLVYTYDRWERHGSPSTLPVDPQAKYPESVDDLLEIYPNASQKLLLEEIRKISGRTPPIQKSNHVMPWSSLWFRLRKIPVTTGKSIGAIPKNGRRAPNHRRRQDPDAPPKLGTKLRSGSSTVDARRGTKAFDILWYPKAGIHAMALKVQSLPTGAVMVLSALMSLGATHLTRADVAKAVEQHPDLGPKGWATFVRYRPILTREGFIANAK